MQPVVFVVPGKTSPAGHERVVAHSHGISGNVAEVRGIAGRGLARHSNGLVAADEDQLRAVYVVRFEKNAVPGRRLRARWKRCPRKVVVRGGASDQIAIALPEPDVVPAVLGYNLKVEVLAEVELSHKPFPVEGLVPESRARYGSAAGREVVRRSLPDHGVGTDPIHSKLAGVERLAESEEPRIGIPVREARVSIRGTEQCGRVSGPVIPRVPHQFRAKLVISHLAEDVAVAHWAKVIELVDSTVPSKRKDTLL